MPLLPTPPQTGELYYLLSKHWVDRGFEPKAYFMVLGHQDGLSVIMQTWASIRDSINIPTNLSRCIRYVRMNSSEVQKIGWKRVCGRRFFNKNLTRKERMNRHINFHKMCVWRFTRCTRCVMSSFKSERALGNAVAQFWRLPGFRGVVLRMNTWIYNKKNRPYRQSSDQMWRKFWLRTRHCRWLIVR